MVKVNMRMRVYLIQICLLIIIFVIRFSLIFYKSKKKIKKKGILGGF